MRLFALPDGTVDRKDRAQWLTVPFDLALSSSATVSPSTPVAQVPATGAGGGGPYRLDDRDTVSARDLERRRRRRREEEEEFARLSDQVRLAEEDMDVILAGIIAALFR